ncbi:MAG: HD domain-containing protein [Lachnospiraceae bacterium]|nr:HD domain-containing protein [Lachnospiraceae bacterium]
MKDKKSYKIVLFTILMIMINFYGKFIADYFQLPIWMDSFGTVVAAYVCDPFCGAVVGFASNYMYGIEDATSIAYSITSIAIGVTVGIAARKKLFETVFGTLTASVIVTIFSVLISTPINIIINNGRVGNVWGDGVASYLLENDFNQLQATAIGEFYVDFLDKVITLIALYVLIRIVRFRRKKEIPTTIAVMLVISIGALGCGMRTYAYAGEVNNSIQTVYDSDNGLPCGEANDVIQTNDGIIWVGTYAGLYRYNGSEFRWMKDYDSVRNVNCLFLDAEGRLWIGTNDNGLSIVINEKINTVIDENEGLPANSVRCIGTSSDGNYYIGTTSGMQIMRFRGGLSKIGELPEIIYASDISADNNGNIATVTNDGELFIVNGEKIVTSLKSDEDQEIFNSVEFDGNGLLYVGTSTDKIYCYSLKGDSLNEKKVIKCNETNGINDISIAEDKTIYICSENGIGYLDSFDKYHMVNTGNFNNSVDRMTIDYQGNLWFASSRLGLLKMSASPFADVYCSAGLQAKVVNSVTTWQNKLYVGTDNGLDIVDTAANKGIQNELTEQLKDVRIRCLKVSSDNALWICTYGKGLWRVTKEGEITAYDSTNGTFGDRVRVVLELSDGTIVASCDKGIGVFRNNEIEKIVLYEDVLSKSMVLCMEEMSDGRVLCGTDGDGIVVIQNGEMIDRYTRENGLSSDVILRVVEDPVGKGAYIITSNGLCYMNANNNICLLERFPYFNNYDLWALDDGQLFVLSSAGIYVVNREGLFNDNIDIEYEILDSKRGLKAGLTVNSWDYMDDAGNLYLSCDTGVYKVNTKDYGAQRRSYRMKISTINLDSMPYELERGEVFNIDRDVTRVEIMPEVVNYTVDDPDVGYYLEGFDAMQTVVSQSELSGITYTNLPAGNYKFHLRVLDNKTGDVIEESVFDLVKENEIYDTRTFKLYLFIVAMLAVAWLTWFIVRTQIQRTINFQKKELEFARNQLKMGNETILAIAKTVDAKDENTSLHSQRVSDYSVMIAKELGFSDEECENLRKAALLHDIGKIGIPDRVLNKPAKLDDKEYAIMKSHVTRGAEILKDFTLVDHAIEGTLFHHERYDGKGYPEGLEGENIPLYGRIIGVADAFDAMTANRVYRKKLAVDVVISELEKGKGTQFDPKLVDIMYKLIEEGTINLKELYADEEVDE